MSKDSSNQSESKAEVIPPVCQSCRFGSGPQRDCSLIAKGDLSALMEQGPCQMDRYIRSRINLILRRNFPLVTGQGDDVYQEAALRFLDPELPFPGAKLKGLAGLRRWLPRFLRNQVIDHLRRQKIITRLRCGACEHYSRATSQRCQLEFYVGPDGELTPNPWWGDRVSTKTDPRKLDPACGEFTWRKPATFDVFDDELVSETPAASKSQEAVRVCLLAIDKLSATSDRGIREAAVIAGHYFSKRSVADLAERSGVSEKTVKRLLASGRVALLKILTEEFGLESPQELLS